LLEAGVGEEANAHVLIYDLQFTIDEPFLEAEDGHIPRARRYRADTNGDSREQAT